MTHVWEEAVLAVSAKLKSGIFGRLKSKTANWTWRLIKYRWQEALTPATVAVQESGETTFDVTVPKVHSEDDFYEFTYDVEVNGKKTSGKDQFTVWPRDYELKAVTKDDGDEKPAKGFRFDVQVAEAVADGDAKLQTDDEGLHQYRAEQKALHDFPAHSPWEIVEWRKRHGRKRECVVTCKPFEADFVWPVPGGDPHKQYVNLADNHGTDEGSEIEVRIAAKDDASKGKTDVPIYVQVTFLEKSSAGDEQSKRSDPPRSLVQPPGKAEKKVWKGTTQLESDGGEAKLLIQLGQAGGDECEVKIGVTEACQDATLKIINWRKLWYQLTLPAGEAAPALGRIEGTLQAVFIEYEKYKDETIAAESGPAGSWFPGDWIGKGAGDRCINIGDHNKGTFHALFSDDKTPLGVHVLCCHTQYDCAGADCVKSYSNIPVKSTTTMTWTDGTTVYGWKKTISGGGVFPNSLLDGAVSLTNGTWAVKGGADSGAIGNDDWAVVPGEQSGTLWLKLPQDAADILDADAKKVINVSFDFFVAKGPYLGESDGTSKWLQLAVVGMANDTMNDVMAHELGHTVNQVVKTKPPGLGTLKHGREYVRNGHQGPHCADGMSESNYNKGKGKGKKYKGDFTGKSECKCIMYGENDSAGSVSSGKYCARCKPFIRAEALTTFH